MTESKADTVPAPAPAVRTISTTSSSSSLLSPLSGQRRVPLADVISSPELPQRHATSKIHTAQEEGENNTQPRKRIGGQNPAQKLRSSQQRPKEKLPTALVLNCDEDKLTAPLTSNAVQLHAVDISSTGSERDSLLDRLREKEKQFDEKIVALDETLLCAERGRVQRDGIIDSLRAEVARLRGQLELAAEAKSHTDELREKILKERTIALEEARAKIDVLHDAIDERDKRIRRLEKVLKTQKNTIAEAVPPPLSPAVEEKMAFPTKATAMMPTTGRGKTLQPQHHEKSQHQDAFKTINMNEDTLAERQRERQKQDRYAASLRALQEEVQALEKMYAITRNEKDTLAEENRVLHSKLEIIQDSMETHVSGVMKAVRSQVDQKRELDAEIVATRLSMARLLRLLGEVPEMRRYLRGNCIDDDMLFTGYTVSAATMHDDAGRDFNCQRKPNSGFITSTIGTGLDDGVYGGNLMFQSSNIYLNGQWCKQLQDIIDDENNFLRRRKICVGDIEDATRSSGRGAGDSYPSRLPPPSDVLKGRQNDKDFWIPYAVFVEAQKFKNRYFPSLSYECFYPFLTSVNRVWNERTKSRLAAEARRRRLYVKQHKEEKRHSTNDEQKMDSFFFRGSSSDLSSSAQSLWRQLQKLQHEVRRRITGKNSLELFNLYNKLTACALKHLRDVQVEHAALLEQYQQCKRLERAQQMVMEFDEAGGRIKTEDEIEGDRIVGVDNEAAVFLRRALSHLVEEVQEISERSASRIVTSCRDLQEFLGALREQKLRAEASQEQEQHLGGEDSTGFLQGQMVDFVPVSTLLRIIDGVLGFVDEVQREVFAARNALSRSATRADERSELLLLSEDANDESESDNDNDDDDVEGYNNHYHNNGKEIMTVDHHEDDEDERRKQKQRRKRRQYHSEFSYA